MPRKTFKIDLHVHSSYSGDCKVSPREVLREAKKKGLDAIGITDHGTRAGGLEAERIARGIKVLVGQEILTKQGEVVVFNLDQDLEEADDLAKTCRTAKDLGGFIIIPHPFDPLRHGIGKQISRVLDYIDAIEAFNPKCFFAWSNKRADEFAREHGIPAVAGSDAHKKEDIGMAHIRAQGQDILEEVKNSRVEMIKKGLGKRGIIKRGIQKGLKI